MGKPTRSRPSGPIQRIQAIRRHYLQALDIHAVDAVRGGNGEAADGAFWNDPLIGGAEPHRPEAKDQPPRRRTGASFRNFPNFPNFSNWRNQ